MIFIDQHMHCSHSMDSKESPQTMIETAIAQGLKYIAFTDHLDKDLFFCKPIYQRFEQLNYEEHIDKITKLQQLYKDQIYVAVGLEVGFSKESQILNTNISNDTRLDVIINSIHLIEGYDCYFQEMFNDMSRKEAYQKYFDAVLESIYSIYDYDIIGHLGYIIRKAPYIDKVFEYKEFKKTLDDILVAIIEKDKAIELNTHTRLDDVNFLPTVELLKQYKKLGGKLITYGSDAHYKERIGEKKELANKVLLDIGFKEIVYYKKRKPFFSSLL